MLAKGARGGKRKILTAAAGNETARVCGAEKIVIDPATRAGEKRTCENAQGKSVGVGIRIARAKVGASERRSDYSTRPVH